MRDINITMKRLFSVKCGEKCSSGKKCKAPTTKGENTCWRHKSGPSPTLPTEFSHFEKLPLPALEKILLTMDRKQLNYVCTHSRQASKICRINNFRLRYNALHPTLYFNQAKYRAKFGVYDIPTSEDGMIAFIQKPSADSIIFVILEPNRNGIAFEYSKDRFSINLINDFVFNRDNLSVLGRYLRFKSTKYSIWKRKGRKWQAVAQSFYREDVQKTKTVLGRVGLETLLPGFTPGREKLCELLDLDPAFVKRFLKTLGMNK